MRRTIIVLVAIALIAGILGTAYWYVLRHPEWQTWAREQFDQALEESGLAGEEAPSGLVTSGFIEAEQTSVSSEVGGRIVALHADEGDEVTQGRVLVELDESLLRAQIEQAEADLALAEANLAQVEASVRQETVDHARARLYQAIVAQQVARVAWRDAQARVENPQELDLVITQTRARANGLDHQVQQAQALADSAQQAKELTDEMMEILRDFEPFNISVDSFTFRAKLPADVKIKASREQAQATYQAWEAWAGLEQARTARDGVNEYLVELLQQRENPLSLQTEASAARSQVELAAANVGLALAHIEGLQIGATSSQIAATEAQVEVARAALETLQVRLEKLLLEAPRSGLVLERPVHVGELAMPGAPLMTLADLDEVNLTVYVPEDEIGKVQLRQPVTVTVDAYPERAFPGWVTFIATEAEFTPKNVQTREERVSMVFAVKIHLPNEDHALKPGMPADAEIGTEE